MSQIYLNLNIFMHENLLSLSGVALCQRCMYRIHEDKKVTILFMTKCLQLINVLKQNRWLFIDLTIEKFKSKFLNDLVSGEGLFFMNTW